MRRPLVVGNWKMHGSRASVETLLTRLLEADLPAGVDLAVCPTFLHIDQAITLAGASQVAVGAQDCSHAQSGALTGEVAPQMLADAGCQWVILGHSERRQFHAETDALVAAKLSAAVAASVAPILCVGETREQREAGEAEEVVGAQLLGALGEQENLAGLVVAYEPVWAIGTGLTATPEQAQAMHAYIRDCLQRIPGVDAAQTRILYGGSVKPDNAAELFAAGDIDGALVGGAALVAEDFLSIAQAAAH
ncbi:MAG: triose-phosphate isomerase [Halioglobus sp.]|nr:triose-phosphate isomerase [Halioglobus sp.]